MVSRECEGDVDDVEVDVLGERARDCDDAWMRTGRQTTLPRKLDPRDSRFQPQLRNPVADRTSLKFTSLTGGYLSSLLYNSYVNVPFNLVTFALLYARGIRSWSEFSLSTS